MKLTPHPCSGRHAALDAEIILHEYTHAVIERLAGGRLMWNTNSSPQGRALAEGFCDYFSLSILNYLTSPNIRTTFGSWIGGSTGIRRLPYDDTFQGTFADLGKLGFREEHDVGQIWATCLFQINRKLGQRVNDAARGCRMGWRIVLDSLPQLAPGSTGPNFLDARDAILNAFSQGPKGSDFQGIDYHTTNQDLWEVFAKFGMGPQALCTGADFMNQHIQADFG